MLVHNQQYRLQTCYLQAEVSLDICFAVSSSMQSSAWLSKDYTVCGILAIEGGGYDSVGWQVMSHAYGLLQLLIPSYTTGWDEGTLPVRQSAMAEIIDSLLSADHTACTCNVMLCCSILYSSKAAMPNITWVQLDNAAI